MLHGCRQFQSPYEIRRHHADLAGYVKKRFDISHYEGKRLLPIGKNKKKRSG